MKIYKYKFQFNNDEGSCVALASMIQMGWYIVGYKAEDGYSWLILHRDY